MISKRINPQVYVYLCMYISEDYHFVCNDSKKLTYFGAEFETECDVSACFYRSLSRICFVGLLLLELVH